jgi:hypothetical protein
VPSRKIKFYTHPDEPRQEQMHMAVGLTNEEVWEYIGLYKVWHRQMHGETEKERLTKGKRIVFWSTPEQK